MMRSMTGFGQSEIATPDFTCVCRIKSVNNRYMQTNVRLDPPDEELEIRIRRVLQEFAARGSIDVNIRMQRSADANRYTFNDGLLKAIRPALDEAGAQVTLDGLLRAGILRLADGESLNSEEDIETILSCFRRAVADWNQSRCMEGASLFSNDRQLF